MYLKHFVNIRQLVKLSILFMFKDTNYLQFFSHISIEGYNATNCVPVVPVSKILLVTYVAKNLPTLADPGPSLP
jgi:hypothetical protein